MFRRFIENKLPHRIYVIWKIKVKLHHFMFQEIYRELATAQNLCISHCYPVLAIKTRLKLHHFMFQEIYREQATAQNLCISHCCRVYDMKDKSLIAPFYVSGDLSRTSARTGLPSAPRTGTPSSFATMWVGYLRTSQPKTRHSPNYRYCVEFW